MKLCNICKARKIRNNYSVCYDCNQKSDSASETETLVYKKESIPKCVRNALFINYFKDSRVGACQCCKRESITMGNFHAGHILAEANGGKTALDNLIPLCALCNTSMGTYNVFDFVAKFNLHHGL
jgi:5-methylcytosine-specific restriction endonuclease McrA